MKVPSRERALCVWRTPGAPVSDLACPYPMGVLPPAGEGEEAARGRFNDGIGLPLGVEKLKQPALKVLAVLAQVDEARVVVVRRVVLVHVRMPV